MTQTGTNQDTREIHHGQNGLATLTAPVTSIVRQRRGGTMTRRITKAQQELLDDLVGGTDIAQVFGVTRAVVSMWQKRNPDFPAPVKVLASGRLYRLSDVQEWHDAWRAGR